VCSRRVAHGRRLLPVLLVLSCLSGLGAAERPRIYAITNATVVPEPGRRIESGTVVMRDGLIEAVGADVVVPSDAVEIDGEGRWVYPGLIDADSGLGLLSAPESAGGPAPPSGERRRAEEPPGAVHPVSRIRPETKTRDLLVPFSGERRRDVERIRNLGFTIVLTRPESGILRGSSAAILLSEERPVAETIVRDGVAQHAAFERGRFGQGYPTSLMGAVAAIRQALLDASRYAEWSARYEADPLGMSRPELHTAYLALAPVLAGRQQLIFHTDDPRDTLLAHRLGREFGLQLAISTSSHEWEVAQQLAASERTLIVSVAFPDKPKVKEDDEALEVSRDAMRRFLEAPSGPARLHEAGVSFALTMRGLKNTADFPKQMRKIIEAGLDEEVALAALTTVPAGLLGIDRVTGTLGPGKIANVLVADGPLFGEETKLRHVFVDGVEYEIEVKEKPKGDPNAVVDPRGEWSVVFEVGGRTIQRSWTIGGETGDYDGTAETGSGTVTFDSVDLEGNAMTVVFPGREGRPSMEVTVIIEGDSFEGVAEFGPRSATISGTRTTGPQGGVR
jgi:imidazolonepropionase-like amidohydrolase